MITTLLHMWWDETYFTILTWIVLYVFSCSPSKKTGHIPGYRFALHLLFFTLICMAITNNFKSTLCLYYWQCETWSGGYSTKFYTGRLDRLRPNPLALYYTLYLFWQKTYSFCISSFDKWYPFHIRTCSLEPGIPLTAVRTLTFKYG